MTSLEETPRGDRNPGRVETRVDLRRRWLLFPLWLCQGLAGLVLPHSFAPALSPRRVLFPLFSLWVGNWPTGERGTVGDGSGKDYDGGGGNDDDGDDDVVPN